MNLKITAIHACLLLSAPFAFAGGVKVEVELYVMSQCPYGVQAEDALFPVLKRYGPQVGLTLGFIGGKTDVPGGAPKFSALHGQPEVDENVRQICARELFPGRWQDYVLERNKDVKAADWEAAARTAGIDAKAVAACAAGPGLKLYGENLALAGVRGADSSPTIYIDGVKYDGPRTGDGFEWEICSALKKRGASLPGACERALSGPKPQGQAGGPSGDCGAAPNAFNLKIVGEKGCAVCAPDLLFTLIQLHPGARISNVDASSSEGLALLKKHKQSVLPLYVLDRAVEREGNFKGKLDSFYSLSAGEYIIRPGPTTFSPSVWLNRGRVQRHLDVFVEALSPETGRVAGELVDFILRESSGTAGMTVSWHPVTQEIPVAPKLSGAPSGSKKPELGKTSATKLTSTNGDAEVLESVRQACLFQYSDFSDFMAYLNCRFYNPADPERGNNCLRPEGKIRECIERGEGEKLVRADAKLAAELEVRAPALLWENRYGPFRWGTVDWEKMVSKGK